MLIGEADGHYKQGTQVPMANTPVPKQQFLQC